jgi:hypothetical protein
MSAKNRAAKLLQITGNNFSEIEPPPDGWRPIHTACVRRDKEEIGKFYIVAYGNIDYIHRDYTIANVKHYHPALLDLACKQLEEKCSAILKLRAESSKFPNLYHLLMKFHGLY